MKPKRNLKIKIEFENVKSKSKAGVKLKFRYKILNLHFSVYCKTFQSARVFLFFQGIIFLLYEHGL